MHRSSIFSFDTFQARFHVSKWWIYLLVLLGLGELVLRVPFVNSHLPQPEPTLWHATLIQAKLDYLKTYQADHGVDVLFIGNSSVQAGVNPQVFDLERQSTEDPRDGAFNASIEGLPPYGVELFLEIYLRYTRPRTIIYGITPQDLNSNSPWAKDVTERVKRSPLAMAESRRGLSGRATALLLDHFYLFRYRFLLHQLLLKGGIATPLPEIYFDARGFHPIEHRLSDVPESQRAMYYNRAGVLNYSVRGEQLDSLRELIRYCTEHNIQLIFVNMPLAQDYFANFDSPDDYKTYLATLDAVAAESNIPVWDMENLSQGDRFSDQDFADFNHLNQYGAEKLSTRIAEQYNQWIKLNSKLGMH